MITKAQRRRLERIFIVTLEKGVLTFECKICRASMKILNKDFELINYEVLIESYKIGHPRMYHLLMNHTINVVHKPVTSYQALQNSRKG